MESILSRPQCVKQSAKNIKIISLICIKTFVVSAATPPRGPNQREYTIFLMHDWVFKNYIGHSVQVNKKNTSKHTGDLCRHFS